jgi:propanol-preferring alcohol dehydrogenase
MVTLGDDRQIGLSKLLLRSPARIVTMRSMRLSAPGGKLEMVNVGRREPGPGQVLVRVLACGVCRTDLHIVDGELPALGHPIVPGHEIVGTVVETGPETVRFSVGQRIGVPWLGWTCGECHYCRHGRENLCGDARFTGYHIDGGYAEFAVADERHCLAIPDQYGDAEAAPLLCAGLIGYRALVMAGDAARLGIYGFGAAAHIVAQVAAYQGRQLFAFTRPGDREGQLFARSLGAVWAGDSTARPPEPLDAAIIFAPVGSLVPAALGAVARGGTVVCAGIHMSDIPSFPYSLLWGERVLRSVANLTRRDGLEFMELAGRTPLQIRVQRYALAQANSALADLREGRLTGAAVLVP